jgi:hypothetical protein
MKVLGFVLTNSSGEFTFNPRSQGDMKQGTNNRRSRSRGSGGKRQYSGGGRNSFESNGPDVKIRGTAQQIQEKYLSLARDAISSGNWVSAEAYFQFAEHYHRIISANASNSAGKTPVQGQNKIQGDDRNSGQKAPQNVVDQENPTLQTDLKVDLKNSSEAALENEAEVIDISPTALAAAVAKSGNDEAVEAPAAASDAESKKAAT